MMNDECGMVKGEEVEKGLGIEEGIGDSRHRA